MAANLLVLLAIACAIATVLGLERFPWAAVASMSATAGCTVAIELTHPDAGHSLAGLAVMAVMLACPFGRVGSASYLTARNRVLRARVRELEAELARHPAPGPPARTSPRGQRRPGPR